MIRIRHIVFIVLFSLCFVTLSGQMIIVSVCLTNKQTNYAVPKTKILVQEIDKTIKTNSEGCFRMALIQGNYSFQIENDEFSDEIYHFNLQTDTTITIQADPKVRNYVLKEVTVFADRLDKVNTVESGQERLSVNDMKNISFLAGEKDVIKAIQLLPGVQPAYEGSANLIVRGGNPDQNLYLLDNTTVFNTNHAMGLLSSYNPAVINSIDFYRGSMPARFGGRLSSVSDVTTKDLILDKPFAAVDVGILSASATASVPLIKNKSALMFSCRRLLLDQIARMTNGVMPFYFYDVSVKWVYNIDSLNKISAGYYRDIDKMKFHYPSVNHVTTESSLTNKWGNNIAYLKWDRQFSARLKNNMDLSFSGYRFLLEEIYNNPSNNLSNYKATLSSSLSSFSLKDRMSYELNDFLSINGGVELSRLSYYPANISGYYGNTNINYNSISSSVVFDASAYMETEFKFNNTFKLKTGIRSANYLSNNSTFNFLEPRISLQFNPTSTSSFKMAYSRMHQPIILLSNQGIGIPVDVWLPSSNLLTPQSADQYSLGYMRESTNYRISSEIYYKQMNHIISYKNGHSSIDFFMRNDIPNNEWQKQMITTGKGWSAGNEWLFEKTQGRFTGWISYTLSWTKVKFAELNNGREFWSNYDRRHVISIVTGYRLNKRWKLNVSWQYLSGAPITIPKYWYINPNQSFIGQFPYGNFDPTLVWGQGERNGSRMKSIHHLDFSLVRTIDAKRFKGSFEIGAYNVYNRKNPYYYYASIDVVTGKPQITSVSLFPVIPYISIKWYPFH